MSARACSDCRKKHTKCLHNDQTAKHPPRQKRGASCYQCRLAKVACTRISGSSCLRCNKRHVACQPQNIALPSEACKVNIKSSNRASRTESAHTVADRSTGAPPDLVPAAIDAQQPQEGLLLPVNQNSSSSESERQLEQSGDVPRENFLELAHECAEREEISQYL